MFLFSRKGIEAPLWIHALPPPNQPLLEMDVEELQVGFYCNIYIYIYILADSFEGQLQTCSILPKHYDATAGTS